MWPENCELYFLVTAHLTEADGFASNGILWKGFSSSLSSFEDRFVEPHLESLSVRKPETSWRKKAEPVR